MEGGGAEATEILAIIGNAVHRLKRSLHLTGNNSVVDSALSHTFNEHKHKSLSKGLAPPPPHK